MLNLKLIGYTELGLPVYSVVGGAPEGEGGGEGESEDDANEQNDGEGGESEQNQGAEEEYAPPTKAEYAKMQAALKKANGEAAQRRKWLDEHGIDPRSGRRYDSDEGDEDEGAKSKPKARKKAEDDEDDTPRITQTDLDKLEKLRKTEGKRAAAREATLTRALTKKAVAAGLADAGWNGKGANLIERMIDLSELEIDDEGEVIGLESQIADVKTEMPEWFKKARPKSAANGGAREVDGAEKQTVKKVKPRDPNGWLSKVSAQIDGEEV